MKSEIDIKALATSLAESNDKDQFEFINTLSLELKVVCKDPYLSGNQPCIIARGLDKNGVALIKALHEFILLRENNQ